MSFLEAIVLGVGLALWLALVALVVAVNRLAETQFYFKNAAPEAGAADELDEEDE